MFIAILEEFSACCDLHCTFHRENTAAVVCNLGEIVSFTEES